MPAIARGRVRPARPETARNPMVCAMVTAVLAATFWIGIVWAAQRIFY